MSWRIFVYGLQFGGNTPEYLRMRLKEMLQFEKENMPGFQWAYEKFLFVWLIVWLGGAIVTLLVSLPLGFFFGESIITFIPLIVWGSVLAVTLILFVYKTIKLRKKLLFYHRDKLAQELFDIDSDEAGTEERILTEEGVIVEAEDPLDHMIIPFEEVEIEFNPHFWGGKLFLELIIKHDGEWLYIDTLNNAYYNFLKKNTPRMQNKALFRLLCDDREKFVKLLLRYNNAAKIEKRLRHPL